MDIAVEISLYPLDAAFIPPISAFIERIGRAQGLKVVTTSLSTQISGAYADVMAVLTREMHTTFSSLDKAVFVIKVIGPLTPAAAA